MYVVTAKSPFWKSTHYTQWVNGAIITQRSRKRADRYSKAEAERIAKLLQGGPNKWVATVEEA